MKLLDFNEDDVLNQLRANMGAEHLGTFELFNPLKHLSWQDRQSLAKDWLSVNGSALHPGVDQSLYFKNSPVVALFQDTLHFAYCDEIKKSIFQGQLNDIQVTTKQQLLTQQPPCEYCLHAMKYQGYDAYRQRHQQYNEGVLKGFHLGRYFTDLNPEFRVE
ncbi:hypothetical protein NBRC116188_26920 [Oceaniserpentilla sp. 4NH20-0058]|uniref:hypothetical protein n=1 Tax=Oceaniserpentilla sp. 4NH20-0058 TaxID=3127660 RepID=UPI00310533A6